MAASLGGCRGKAPFDAERSYKEAEDSFARGDLPNVERLSAKGYHLTATNTLAHAQFLVMLVRGFVYQGYSDKACALMKELLPSGSPTDLKVQHHTLFAIALKRAGRSAESAQMLREAESLADARLPQPELHSAEGSVQLESNDLAAAEQSFQRALSEANATHSHFLQMQILVNLGVTALRGERFEQALEYFAAAHSIATSIASRVAAEKILGNTASTYYRLGDMQRALTTFREAKEQAERIGATSDLVSWQNEEGRSLARLGDLGGAKALYERSLQEARAMHMQEQEYDAALALAGLLREDRSADAKIYLDEAGSMAKLRDNLQEQLQVKLLNVEISVHRSGQDAGPELSRMQADPKTPISIQWQAQQDLALLNMKAGKHAAADLWFHRAIDTFQQQRGSLRQVESELPFYENGVHLYRDSVEHLIGEGKSDEALAVLDQSRARSLLSGLGNDRSGEEALSTLSRKAQRFAGKVHGTVLVYYLLPNTSYLWAVSRNRIGFYRLPGEEEITQLVRRHEELITNSRRDPLDVGNRAGQQLYEMLVGPAQSQIKPGDGVYVMADRGLSQLNFDTLLTPGEHPHFWIEDVPITNVASLRLLTGVSAQPAQKQSGRLLLVGNPQYPAELALPHAEEEMQKVATHFSPGQRTVLSGRSATSTRYKEQDPGQFTYIHFVAHAEASLSSPMDSYVLLTGDADKLYARDIVNRPLNADLVTLSTCYSSGTRTYSGEGLVGLAWAFERAGSRNVIGSLWEVSDDSAPELMDRLYADLARGMRPDQALRDAKLAALHSEKYSRPFYWAPFQLYSNSSKGRTP